MAQCPSSRYGLGDKLMGSAVSLSSSTRLGSQSGNTPKIILSNSVSKFVYPDISIVLEEAPKWAAPNASPPWATAPAICSRGSSPCPAEKADGTQRILRIDRKSLSQNKNNNTKGIVPFGCLSNHHPKMAPLKNDTPCGSVFFEGSRFGLMIAGSLGAVSSS